MVLTNIQSRRKFIKKSNLDFEHYKNNFDAIVIGASAGGIEALRAILEKINEPYPIPIIVVQHIGANSNRELSRFFDEICNLKAKDAEDKEFMAPGVIYFAPSGYHLLIENDKSFSLTVEEPVNYARPSIDVLFSSAAAVFQKRLLGIILTGANHDGAQGLSDIKELGGTVIVEDPQSAKVPTMPQAAMDKVEPNLILNIDGIHKLVMELK